MQPLRCKVVMGRDLNGRQYVYGWLLQTVMRPGTDRLLAVVALQSDYDPPGELQIYTFDLRDVRILRNHIPMLDNRAGAREQSGAAKANGKPSRPAAGATEE